MNTDSSSAANGDQAALALRLEALAAQSDASSEPDLPVGPVLAASLTGLRAELGAMHADLQAMREELSRQASRPLAVAPPSSSDSSLEDAVEERLAAIEDTLDGLAERFESLARDSAMDAGERLASLDDRIAALAQSLQAERSAAAQYRERSGLAAQDQAAALDEWAEAVRGGLEDLGEAVASSLSSLGTSVTSATTGSRDADRRHVEALLAELTENTEAGFEGLRLQIGAYQEPMDLRIDELGAAVADGFAVARERLVEDMSGTIARLETANAEVRATVEGELVDLRADLADALDEVRERIENTVGVANESIAATLEEHQATSAELRDGIAASLDEHYAASAELRDGFAATLDDHHAASAELRDGLAATSEGLRDSVQALSGELQAGVDAAAAHAEATGDRVAQMHEVVGRLDVTLSDLQQDWRPQVDAVVAESRAAAQGVLAEVQAEVDAAIAELKSSLSAQVAAIREVSGSLGGGTDRLVNAGQALLAYLGERDRWLERERDRVLHEVLDEFAQGLSAKERRAVSSRMGDAVNRRRDARDAERFRRTEAGKPAIEIPAIPPELAVLDEPVSDVPAPSAAVATTVPAQPEESSPALAKLAVKSTSTAAKKTAAPRKTAVTKKVAPAKKTAVKSVAKKAAPVKATTRQTGAKRAAATKPAAKRTASSTTRSR